MATKKPTVLIGENGVEYVIRNGDIREKCLHKTRRDESMGKMRKEVCAECGKVLIYNPDTNTQKSDGEVFRERYGRNPMELTHYQL